MKRPIITYGTSSQADLVISDIELRGLESEFRLTYKGEDLGMFRLPHPPGIHNVRNAAAAAAVALYLNVPAELIREGLAKFARSRPPLRHQRRRQRHHGHRRLRPSPRRNSRPRSKPRAAASSTALLVLFQPHRYSARSISGKSSARAFNQADVLVITDIYAASEAPIPGVTSEALAAAIREAGHKNVQYIRSMQDGIGSLLKKRAAGRRDYDHRSRKRQPRQQRVDGAAWH